MTNAEAVNWLINITADIGKAEHSDLWHYEQALSEIREMLEDAHTETHDNRTETHACDLVDRQAAIDAAIDAADDWDGGYSLSRADMIERAINNLPSAQPERTCVNCGRTANNGGWYADGGTRCPIEEHYALPKDGYCHLWEKRNVTDDDYPERREE